MLNKSIKLQNFLSYGRESEACELTNRNVVIGPNGSWFHLQQRKGDGWGKPSNASDADCHLMVECMENRFLADHQTLKAYFGQGFRDNALPAISKSVEQIGKAVVLDGLKRATRDCKTKGEYGKGAHSFDLVGQIDPGKVMVTSPWAKRWVVELKKRMGISTRILTVR
jgi:hypothetical protein